MSGLLSNRLCVPLFLTRVFHLKELHMLNRGQRNGLSSCRFGCRLGCHLAAGLAARLEGLAQGVAALEAGLAAALGFVPSTHKAGTALIGCSFIQSSGFRVHASVGKNICQTPYSTVHHEHPLPTQSQCRTHCHCLLQHHLGDHYQQMSAMTHQNLSQSVRHGMTALALTLRGP